MAVLGMYSGLLSFPAMVVAVPLGPGAVFGAMVACRLTRGKARRAWRVGAVTAWSTLAWLIANTIQSNGGGEGPLAISCWVTAAGFVGSLIAGTGLLAVLGWWRRWDVLAGMVGLGTAAGAMFALLVLRFPNNNAWWGPKFALGFAQWQAAVAWPLGRLPEAAAAPEDAGLS